MSRVANAPFLKQRVVKRELRRLLAASGFRPVRLYELRHTVATLGIAAGVSVKVISDQLGHASISFTLERYSHVFPSIPTIAHDQLSMSGDLLATVERGVHLSGKPSIRPGGMLTAVVRVDRRSFRSRCVTPQQAVGWPPRSCKKRWAD
jgi:hypothetical protein